MSGEELRSDVDLALYRRALATEGFFDVAEARLLMRVIRETPSGSAMLEIGSYRGRSTLFALAALRPAQQLLVVDNFRVAAAYRGHSFRQLHEHLDDQRAIVLPMTLAQAYSHLRAWSFTVAFIDGDHSFFGAAQDIALTLGLLPSGASLLCHDVAEPFPGVVAALRVLIDEHVLEAIERVGTLMHYRVISRPHWLLDPASFQGQQLP